MTRYVSTVPWPRSTASTGTHVISRYEDVKFALRHPEIFSSDVVAVDIGQDRPLIPLQIDPPEHAKYRRLMDPQLGAREIAPLEADTRKLVNEIIDGFAERGTCDFHAEFSVPVPCTVFLQLTGLPLDNIEQFLTWKDNIIRPDVPYGDMDAAANIRKTTGQEMYAYFGDVIDDRVANPGDDVISRFVHGLVEDRAMSRDEILDICLPLHPRWSGHRDVDARLQRGLPGATTTSTARRWSSNRS